MDQSLVLPCDISVLILYYKISLEDIHIKDDTMEEVARLVKILSNPGVDKIWYYVNLIVDKYTRPMRMTPELFDKSTEKIWRLKELAPELLKYDCYSGCGYGQPKAGKFAIEIIENSIIVNFPINFTIWFKLKHFESACYIKIKQIYDPDDMNIMDERYDINENMSPREIIDIIVEWAKRIKQFYDSGFEVSDFEYMIGYLAPGVEVDYEQEAKLFTPGVRTDTFKKIKSRDI